MKVIFLDRDNTINYDPGYLSDPNKVILLPNVIEGLKLLQENNYEFIIITNQSGIGRGYYTLEDFYKVNNKILELLGKQKIYIKDILFCPHTDEDNCNCRKPKPGMLVQALEKYPQIDKNKSWIIGDSIRDIQAGEKLQIQGILLGNTNKTNIALKNLKIIAKDLKEAAEYIILNK